jgi:FkbM family methyltransferase
MARMIDTSVLFEIQSQLKFKGNLKTEIPEQLMTAKHLSPNHCVLELGGSIGRNSCIINHILENKENHVVVEPSPKELSLLKEKRDMNNFKFKIENSAISDVPLFSRGWYTFPTNVPGSTKVNIITFDEIKEKYNLNFDALVVDNEGNFTNMLRAFPSIMSNIKMIIIEHDFNSAEDIKYFYETMRVNNMILSDKHLKTDNYGPGSHWRDGVIGDPIFVSVWKKAT